MDLKDKEKWIWIIYALLKLFRVHKLFTSTLNGFLPDFFVAFTKNIYVKII